MIFLKILVNKIRKRKESKKNIASGIEMLRMNTRGG